jgi:hypothetical protein
VLSALSLSFSGCGLIPIPYFVDARGPLRGVRVIDAVDGRDIAQACVTFHTALGMTNWMKFESTHAVVPSDEKAELAQASSRLVRQPDGSFRLPRRMAMGLIRPFGITVLGCALYNPPASIICVLAPGYQSAGLTFYLHPLPSASVAQQRQPVTPAKETIAK